MVSGNTESLNYAGNDRTSVSFWLANLRPHRDLRTCDHSCQTMLLRNAPLLISLSFNQEIVLKQRWYDKYHKNYFYLQCHIHVEIKFVDQNRLQV